MIETMLINIHGKNITDVDFYCFDVDLRGYAHYIDTQWYKINSIDKVDLKLNHDCQHEVSIGFNGFDIKPVNTKSIKGFSILLPKSSYFSLVGTYRPGVCDRSGQKPLPITESFFEALPAVQGFEFKFDLKRNIFYNSITLPRNSSNDINSWHEKYYKIIPDYINKNFVDFGGLYEIGTPGGFIEKYLYEDQIDDIIMKRVCE